MSVPTPPAPEPGAPPAPPAPGGPPAAPPAPAQPPAPAPAEGDLEEPFDPDRARQKIHKTNAEAAALRARLKAAEDQLAAHEEAGKTEVQRATDRAAAAEQRAADLEQQVLRAEVAAEHGLTPAQAKRLVGATREELAADAAELIAEFGQQSSGGAPVAPPARPTSAPVAGTSDPTQTAIELDPAKLADAVPRGGLY